MTNYWEIMRLNSIGYSQRIIASSEKVSRNTVSEILKMTEKQQISLPLDDISLSKVHQEMERHTSPVH